MAVRVDGSGRADNRHQQKNTGLISNSISEGVTIQTYSPCPRAPQNSSRFLPTRSTKTVQVRVKTIERQPLMTLIRKVVLGSLKTEGVTKGKLGFSTKKLKVDLLC